MVDNSEYKIGSIIVLQKSHPSQTIEWEVVRLGADIKIKSLTSEGLYIMMSRKDFNRKVLKIIKY